MLKRFFIVLILFLILCGMGIFLRGAFFSKQPMVESKPPLVSVIMSTYNRASLDHNLLSKAIESILNQTYKEFEFIIINDGSIDETKNILAEFQKKDSRIKILTNEKNEGLPNSLNKGLAIAQGKYIARMDDDDYSFSIRLKKQVDFLEKNPHITATGCSYRKDFILPADPDRAKIRAFWWVPVIHPCVMIRTDFIKKHNIQYVNTFPNAEDMPFWFDVTIKYGGLISNLKEILLYKKDTSVKKENYQEVQDKSVEAYRQYACNYFNEKKKVYSSWMECYHDLLSNEKAMAILNEKKLKKYLKSNYPIENSMFFIHPEWSDFVLIEGNDVRRLSIYQKKATLIEKQGDFIKIKWADAKIESFKKKGEAFYLQ